jgi:REP element-mobilizing transposase RayT
MRRHDTYFPPVLVRSKFALMTRLARMVVSGLPHHVTRRGNRRESIFFEDGDQETYRDLLGEQTRKANVEVWAYCLMPKHMHLILNPRQAEGSAVRSVKHIAAAPISSMHGAAGRDTSSRAVSRQRPRTNGIWFQQFVCQPESCPGTAGDPGRGLALVECQSTYERRR